MASVLIVYAHPEPTSFGAALVRRARAALAGAGHRVVVSDLYLEGFDPKAGRHDFLSSADAGRFHYQTEQANAASNDTFCDEIAREQARVTMADVLVLVFPLWWGAPPAILKGWFERVLAYGFAYVDGARFDTGLFRGRRALLAVTTGGTTARFAPDGVLRRNRPCAVARPAPDAPIYGLHHRGTLRRLRGAPSRRRRTRGLSR